MMGGQLEGASYGLGLEMALGWREEELWWGESVGGPPCLGFFPRGSELEQSMAGLG